MDKNLVYDLGFHKGEDTPYYLSKGFKVIAVEANPLLYQKGKNKFKKEIESGQLTLVNVGIASKKEDLPFWINHKKSEWSSFNKNLGCRKKSGCHSVNVQCIPITDLFVQYGVPFFLKTDIEGHDIYCIEQIDSVNKPKFISCESGPDILEMLKKKGYDKYKLINNYDGFNPLGVQTEKSKWRALRLYLRWYFYLAFPFLTDFPMGASGPLPDETSGKWLNYEEASSLYEKWNDFVDHENDGIVKNLTWVDFHSTY